MIFEILISLIIVIIIANFFKKGGNYPPGPRGLPFFGSIMPVHMEDARKLHRKYGDIFMVKSGAIRILYMADYQITKEAFSLLDFSDRPKLLVLSSIRERLEDGDYLGLIHVNGERWSHNRRFALKNLRNLGMGKSKLEAAIIFEVEDLVRSFSSLPEAEAVELPFAINVSILNVIFQLIASHRYAFDDEFVQTIMKKINDVQASGSFLLIPDLFPVVNYLPKVIFNKLTGFQIMINIFHDFYKDIIPFIDEHKKNLDPNDPKDLIDEYLIEMNKKENTFLEMFDLLRMVFDLFVAGNDTTANMLKWTLLYMAKYPNVQHRVQKEIDKFVPRDRLPGLEHRNSLALVEAVINESLRMASFTPFGLFHATRNSTTLRGYSIPKNTVVIPLAFLDHENSKYWNNPKEFNPDRFLDSSGNLHWNRQGFQPFSIGRRQCLGEPLARMELYLLTSALLHRFTFSPPPGQEIDIEPKKYPMINMPKDQKLSINKRE